MPTLFWADKDLPRKLLIAEWRTEFCVQFRGNEKLGSTREVKSAAGTDFSGRVRVARASNGGPAKAHPVRCMIPLCISKRVSQAPSRTSAIQD